jgi:hypothetical protein
MREIVAGIPELSETVENLIMASLATILTGRDSGLSGGPLPPLALHSLEFNNFFELLSTVRFFPPKPNFLKFSRPRPWSRMDR